MSIKKRVADLEFDVEHFYDRLAALTARVDAGFDDSFLGNDEDFDDSFLDNDEDFDDSFLDNDEDFDDDFKDAGDGNEDCEDATDHFVEIDGVRYVKDTN
jgi:hypothetical protein